MPALTLLSFTDLCPMPGYCNAITEAWDQIGRAALHWPLPTSGHCKEKYFSLNRVGLVRLHWLAPSSGTATAQCARSSGDSAPVTPASAHHQGTATHLNRTQTLMELSHRLHLPLRTKGHCKFTFGRSVLSLSGRTLQQLSGVAPGKDEHGSIGLRLL
jgi:hypothetical protein